MQRKNLLSLLVTFTVLFLISCGDDFQLPSNSRGNTQGGYSCGEIQDKYNSCLFSSYQNLEECMVEVYVKSNEKEAEKFRDLMECKEQIDCSDAKTRLETKECIEAGCDSELDNCFGEDHMHNGVVNWV